MVTGGSTMTLLKLPILSTTGDSQDPWVPCFSIVNRIYAEYVDIYIHNSQTYPLSYNNHNIPLMYHSFQLILYICIYMYIYIYDEYTLIILRS